MARLNVSEVLCDPLFADKFTIIRRTETIEANGRSTITSMNIPNIVATVVPDAPAGNDRREDGQITARVVSLVSKFQFRAAAEGVQPDQFDIDGTRFTVTEVMPFKRFGQGFYEVKAMSMTTSNPPI